MAVDGDSFLPRIQSVFYAVFDERQGPKIVFQVPEGLIGSKSSSGLISGSTSFSSSPIPSTPSTETSTSSSRASSISLASHTDRSRVPSSRPQKRSLSLALRRLVICATKKYRIIGFPAELRGKYERNYFRFNLCFVFDRSADLSCYEPVVRKVTRVLSACEEESLFLSSPETSPKIHAILEQLYEDLNSYSETSIPVDRFNSIELKILPFYPNPPPVKDWEVPLALIDLKKSIEPNWDLTIVKVCQYIDGTNHVSRIAHLADCDIELTRQAISHLLYYQVIMTIDIFQYSNMYTLRKSIQWLADEPHVKDECGAYVAKPGKATPEWPQLLYLYSRLKPGKSVFEWMQDRGIRGLGVDVRRFTSFGVIKGFLRRVHRWPVLLSDSEVPRTAPMKKSPSPPSPDGRKRALSLTSPPALPSSPTSVLSTPQSRLRRRTSDASPVHVSAAGQLATARTTSPLTFTTDRTWGTLSKGSSSAATSTLEELQARGARQSSRSKPPPSPISPRTNRTYRGTRRDSEGRRNSLVSPQAFYEAVQSLAGGSATVGPNAGRERSPERRSLFSSGPFATLPSRPRPSRSPSSPAVTTQASLQEGVAPVSLSVSYPDELTGLLDGEHHTDELCTRFEVGWPVLETWLAALGGGKGNGDYGKVLIIYR